MNISRTHEISWISWTCSNPASPPVATPCKVNILPPPSHSPKSLIVKLRVCNLASIILCFAKIRDGNIFRSPTPATDYFFEKKKYLECFEIGKTMHTNIGLDFFSKIFSEKMISCADPTMQTHHHPSKSDK